GRPLMAESWARMLFDPSAPARLVVSTCAAPPAAVRLEPIGAPSGGSYAGGGGAFDPRSRSARATGGPRRRHWLGYRAASCARRSRDRGVAYFNDGCGDCRPPVAGYHGAVS